MLKGCKINCMNCFRGCSYFDEAYEKSMREKNENVYKVENNEETGH